MNTTVLIAAMSGLLALLSGCSGLEPYDRSYVWRPTGANESNLAAMAVNPADLAYGHGTGPADGQIAAAAVDRLRYDRVKSLSGTNNGNTPAVAGTAALIAN